MKNELSDKYLSELFKNDELNCQPDPAIKSRLGYNFMLKESQSRIRQNSFSGIFTWLFSFNNIPAKAALVSMVMFVSILNFQQKTNTSGTVLVDSASMQTISFIPDTVLNRPFNSDTCSIPGK